MTVAPSGVGGGADRVAGGRVDGLLVGGAAADGEIGRIGVGLGVRGRGVFGDQVAGGVELAAREHRRGSRNLGTGAIDGDTGQGLHPTAANARRFELGVHRFDPQADLLGDEFVGAVELGDDARAVGPVGDSAAVIVGRRGGGVEVLHRRHTAKPVRGDLGLPREDDARGDVGDRFEDNVAVAVMDRHRAGAIDDGEAIRGRLTGFDGGRLRGGCLGGPGVGGVAEETDRPIGELRA